MATPTPSPLTPEQRRRMGLPVQAVASDTPSTTAETATPRRGTTTQTPVQAQDARTVAGQRRDGATQSTRQIRQQD